MFSYIGIKVIELSAKAKGNSRLVNLIVELVLEPLNKISVYSFRMGLLIPP
jgi:hypothetical protein